MTQKIGLLEVFDQAVREIKPNQAEENSQQTAQPETSQVKQPSDALAEIFKQVRNNQMSILSDGEGGLYPYPRTSWMRHQWGEINKHWFACFPEVFKAVEDGSFIPELSFHAKQAEEKPKLNKFRPPHVTTGMLEAWKTSRPWLLDHLPELDSHGWTRSQLFRAGRIKYPCGPWGVAFSRNWLRPDVQVTIEPDGAISWTWVEPTGKEITQASRPKP